MNSNSDFETINDADLDNVAGGRGHRVVARSVGYAGSYGYNYNYGLAGTTVPSIVGGYSYAPPVTYPTAYAPSYPGYGMRLGTAI